MNTRGFSVWTTFLLLLCGVLSPLRAEAFCGFYVAGGDSSLYNDATQVVLMRNGTTTVLSMQNNYQGPPADFAMVIPVENVLAQTNVKTLDSNLFETIDTLTAPRLVEYWERDPCSPMIEEMEEPMAGGVANDAASSEEGVQIEAQFSVGEYDIVILSASDSAGLETWLGNNDYNIPSGAQEKFEPYVASGMKFFVAKVDITKVTIEDGQAVLSPLRIEMPDAANFRLPIRLGLINSSGSQDLLVYTLGIGQRYELANRPNVMIPTNIQVVNEIRDNFGAFYQTLFNETTAQNPGAAITEYSWDASTCDPCPGPMLTQEDFLTLGADVINNGAWAQWVITRIHIRYDSDSIGDDLVFKEAQAIAGGREFYDASGELESGWAPSSYNNFQGRYIIRHLWEGEVLCDQPEFGMWGGPNGSTSPGQPQPAVSPNSGGESSDQQSSGNDSTSSLPSEELSDLVIEDIPSLDIVSTVDNPDSGVRGRRVSEATAGCGCAGGGATGGLTLLILGWFLRRRKWLRTW